jgi:alkanesulfonate monooxygenase SsuD/methylene tetrahydromethanopterin reductase-like flavin-dependent oxidoreductase (luciferase family)
MHRNGWENTNKSLISMAQTLEDNGIRSVLLPYGPTGTDFLVHVPGILQSTKKIKVMIALPAYAVTPEYAAKTFNTMQWIRRDSLDLNLVAGNYDKNSEVPVLSNYPGDISHIESHEKRVALTEKWMEKFNNLVNDYGFPITLYVVGTSETTINIANNYTDYIIININALSHEFISKANNCKVLLVIDPLIIDNEEDLLKVEYHSYEYTKKIIEHPIKGTYEEVVQIIKDISQEFGIKDFMIHTDQKDITNLLKLVNDMSYNNLIQ